MAEGVSSPQQPVLADEKPRREPRGLRFGIPPAPVVAAGLSGFVIGVFLTLLASGTILRGSQSVQRQPVATPPASTVVPSGTIQQRVTKIAARILGPMPANPGQSRLTHVDILPVGPLDNQGNPNERFSPYRSVVLAFRLDNHPFGRPWRLKAAQVDVFTVMKALYTSQLPVYDIEMDGYFPLPGSRTTKPQRALEVLLTYKTASTIPWKRWGRGNESRLWNLLTYRWVSPRFA